MMGLHRYTDHRYIGYSFVVKQQGFKLGGCNLVAFDFDEFLAKLIS
jgi:hypothetical protein